MMVYEITVRRPRELTQTFLKSANGVVDALSDLRGEEGVLVSFVGATVTVTERYYTAIHIAEPW